MTCGECKHWRLAFLFDSFGLCLMDRKGDSTPVQPSEPCDDCPCFERKEEKPKEPLFVCAACNGRGCHVCSTDSRYWQDALDASRKAMKRKEEK